MSISEDQLITVTILKWDKFNKRKDLKHPWWFAFSNKFLEDPEMEELNNAEAWAWVYVMILSSQKRSPTVTIPWNNVRRQYRFKPKDLISALQKLLGFQIIEMHVQDPNGSRTGPERIANGTEQDITLQDKTLHNTQPDGGTFAPQDLIQVWNKTAKSLPKAEKLSEGRIRSAKARIHENPDPGYWIKVVERIEASSFCRNQAVNSKGWIATFDWLVTPEAHIKVMEGKYDDRTANSSSESLADIVTRMKRSQGASA